jgi:uncharacterized membrane protein
MRSYWESTRLGWTIIAAMFAVAILEWPVAPPSLPTHWNLAGSIDRYGGRFQGLLLLPLSAALVWGLIGALAVFRTGKSDAAVRRRLISLGLAILLIFISGFSAVVLWVNGVALNVNYLLLPALLLMMCVALANLLLHAAQGRRRGAMPG